MTLFLLFVFSVPGLCLVASFAADFVKLIRADRRAEPLRRARQLDAAVARCSREDRVWLTAHYGVSIAPDPDMTHPDLRRPL